MDHTSKSWVRIEAVIGKRTRADGPWVRLMPLMTYWSQGQVEQDGAGRPEEMTDSREID